MQQEKFQKILLVVFNIPYLLQNAIMSPVLSVMKHTQFQNYYTIFTDQENIRPLKLLMELNLHD